MSMSAFPWCRGRMWAEFSSSTVSSAVVWEFAKRSATAEAGATPRVQPTPLVHAGVHHTLKIPARSSGHAGEGSLLRTPEHDRLFCDGVSCFQSLPGATWILNLGLPGGDARKRWVGCDGRKVVLGDPSPGVRWWWVRMLFSSNVAFRGFDQSSWRVWTMVVDLIVPPLAVVGKDDAGRRRAGYCGGRRGWPRPALVFVVGVT